MNQRLVLGQSTSIRLLAEARRILALPEGRQPFDGVPDGGESPVRAASRGRDWPGGPSRALVEQVAGAVDHREWERGENVAGGPSRHPTSFG